MVRVLLKELLCISAAFLAVALCNGCATDDHPPNGVHLSGNASQPRVMPLLTMADTLRPTFAWTPPDQPGFFTYELRIWKGKLKRDNIWHRGDQAVDLPGIKATTYTLVKPLERDTVYVWSVRTQADKKHYSDWAAYNQTNPSPPQNGRRGDAIFCPFKTPAK